METIDTDTDTDIAIVGGAGLRAAIALAEADPSLRIALISKVDPEQRPEPPCRCCTWHASSSARPPAQRAG